MGKLTNLYTLYCKTGRFVWTMLDPFQENVKISKREDSAFSAFGGSLRGNSGDPCKEGLAALSVNKRMQFELLSIFIFLSNSP